jgi:hypothetical protein
MPLRYASLLVFAAWSIFMIADTNAAEDPVQVRGDMFEVQEDNVRAMVHFGKMNVGARRNFKIKIQNSLGYQLRLGEADSSGLVKVISTDSTVEMGADLEMEVTFETPSSPKSTSYSQSIRFGDKSDGKQLLQITLSCELTGVLALPQPRHFLSVKEAGKGDDVLSMPLVISDPVRPENLTVSMSDSMSGVLATIKSSEDNDFELEFVVPSGTVPDEGIGGAFFVTDAVTKQKVNGYINIVKDAAVKVVPHAIQFVPDGEGFARASAMILFSDRSGESNNLAIVDAAIGDWPVELSTKSIGKHAARISLKFPEEKLAGIAETERTINWVIRSDRGVGHSASILTEDLAGRPERSSMQGASFFEALMANHEAIQEFDVGIYMKQSSELAGGAISTLTRRTRLQRSSQNGEIMVCNDLLFDVVDDDGNQVRDLKTELHWLHDGDQVTSVGENGIKSFRVHDPEAFSLRNGVPRFETLGVFAFPDTLNIKGSELQFWKSLRIPSVVKRTDPGAKQTKVVVNIPSVNGESTDFTWMFDNSTQMPSSRSAILHMQSGEDLRKVASKFRWIEKEGIWLPSYVSRAEVTSSSYEQGDPLHLMKYTDCWITWFAVETEKPLSETPFFDPEKLSTMEQLKEFLDPVKSMVDSEKRGLQDTSN